MKKYSWITREKSRRTSPTRTRTLKLLAVGAVAVFLLWLVPQLLAQTVALVATPVQATKTWLFESTGNLPHYFRDRRALVAENERLREELALAGGQDQVLKLLKAENDELRRLLGETEADERLLAGIIGRPDALPYDVLVIDKGSRDGVVQDAPVYIGEHQVIGLVRNVYFDSAVVELVTTPDVVSSVYIVGPDIYTNAVGMGGGQLRVGVPQGVTLSVGDSVILPAAESGVFGTINHVESLPTRPEQHGYVSTDIPLQSLRLVAVGRAPLRSISFSEAQEVVSEGLSDLLQVPVPEGVLVVTDSATSTARSSSATATSTATTSAAATDDL